METTAALPPSKQTDPRAEFVDFFRRGLAQGDRDRFIEHFLPRIDSDVVYRQPLSRGARGHAGFRRLFTSVFAAVPDLHGTVHRWGPTTDGVLIEFTLQGTLGGDRLAIDVVDRIVLRENNMAANNTYFDPLPLLRPLSAHPLLALRLLPRLFPTRAERALDPTRPVGTRVLDLMAGGRLLLAATTLIAPRSFAAALGVTPTPELTYTTRLYGARALAMGLGFRTGGDTERRRWHRLSLAVDTTDTASGLWHLARRDVPIRAGLPMVALTGSYAVLGGATLAAEPPRVR